MRKIFTLSQNFLPCKIFQLPTSVSRQKAKSPIRKLVENFSGLLSNIQTPPTISLIDYHSLYLKNCKVQTSQGAELIASRLKHSYLVLRSRSNSINRSRHSIAPSWFSSILDRTLYKPNQTHLLSFSSATNSCNISFSATS